MNLREWCLLLTVSILWGTSFFFIEVALRELGSFTVVFLRITLAALLVLVVTYSLGERLPRSLLVWRKFFILGLLNNTLPFSLITWGQIYITSSMASILNAAAPLMAVVLTHYLTDDEHLTWNRASGVLIGIAGCRTVGGSGSPVWQCFPVTGAVGGAGRGPVLLIGRNLYTAIE